MKVVDKINSCGPTKAYEDVPEELLEFTPGCRVQPAPFLDQPQYKFFFMKRIPAGEDITCINGGFVIRGENRVKYAFDLDEVIVYCDKKTIKSYEPKDAQTCGFIKKDGSRCLIKSKTGFCRFHKGST